MQNLAASWPTIIFHALLRPSAFMAFLDQGWWAIRRAALVALWTQATTLAIGWWGMRQLTAVPTNIIIGSIISVGLLAMLIGMIPALFQHNEIIVPRLLLFWQLRTHIAFTPWLSIIIIWWTITWYASDSWLSSMLIPAASTGVAVMAMGAAGAVTIRLHNLRNTSISRQLRWSIAFATLLIALSISNLPIVWQDEQMLLIPTLIGVTLGMLRACSWLWEAGWSLLLLAALRLGMSSQLIRKLHPASFDELSLLPLPGLAPLLVSFCRRDLSSGIAWLLAVEQHSGQRRVVPRALHMIAQDAQIAHPTLLALSTMTDGTALLRRLSRAPNCPELVHVYAQLSTVPETQAWPTTIERVRALLKRQRHHPTTSDLLLTLEISSIVLNAIDWQEVRRVERLVPPPGASHSRLVRLCALTIHTVLHHDGKDMSPHLRAQIQQSGSWSSQLLATLYEHLLFLHRIEQQRRAAEQL